MQFGYSRYANLHGNSGVRSYTTDGPDEDHPDRIRSITVQFLGGAEFTYSERSAGPLVVEDMISHAENGIGLQRYINFNKPGYV